MAKGFINREVGIPDVSQQNDPTITQVEEVVFYDEYTDFPEAGELNIIYVAIAERKLYHWKLAVGEEPNAFEELSPSAFQALFYTDYASFPETGEEEYIYVDETTNKLWRWRIGIGEEPNAYVELSSSEAYQLESEKGQFNGYASLDGFGKVPLSQIPVEIATTEYADTAAADAVAALVDSAPSALNTLNELAAAINDDASFAASVTTALGTKVPTSRTINGYALSGDVTITKSDVGLGNVDNTSDANKPISTATQTALDAKVPVTRTINGYDLSANRTLVKGDIGLGNVDNTSDANKPVSTATQTALNAKQDAANISNDIGTDTGSTTKYPSVDAMEEYIAAEIAEIPTISDGDKGDITISGSGTVFTIDNGVVTAAKQANMAADTIKGRANGAGTGVEQDLTATQVRTIINVANGATANDTDANLKARANHTGTQTAATISDFNTAALTAAPAETVNSIGTLISGATSKTDLVSDDEFGVTDSESSNVLKAISYSNLLTNLAADLKSTLGVHCIPIACSDETTALTTGTGKVTFRMPYAFTLTGIRASLTTAQTSGSIFTVDVNEAGSTILSPKITIDNGEKTSTTAATAPVLSDTSLGDDSEITIDIDQIGDGTAKGLKVYLIGYKT